jgi:hypothetical protein
MLPAAFAAFAAMAVSVLAVTCSAQSVGLPLPRLLTTTPSGGQVGTELDVTISGEHIEDAGDLLFDHPGVTATRKMDAEGKAVPNAFRVKIASDCPVGLYEARVLSRLGISSSRVFSVDALPQIVPPSPNTRLETACELSVNSVCSAALTNKTVDYYAFQARQGQRYLIHCAARGIDSKLDAVLIVADAAGKDLIAERRGGSIDFTAAANGRHLIKVHDLTFKGGPPCFYRLSLRELAAGDVIPAFPTTQAVNAFSWPPEGVAAVAPLAEIEPNHQPEQAQKISLPCDLAGKFFPAADVDRYEFTAAKGEVWWIEIASERLGRPTDPSVLVQKRTGEGAGVQWVDVAEFNDIPSPIKPSSNGYSYDGPPYDGGSSDLLGKLEIKEDGVYQLRVNDLFGGTRSDDRNIYRLCIRKAAPDFALAAWRLHFELRNGDRNAVSKPLALRAGTTVALEVLAMRRDGFDGEIELAMDGLPPGVTAHGFKIPAGQSRGIMIVSADQDASPSWGNVTITGRATIDGTLRTHHVRMAEMAWPIPDAWGEIPAPRLVRNLPVSVTRWELAPLTIAPAEKMVYEATVGSKLTIPLLHTRRSEFSGSVLQLRTFGPGFEQVPKFDVSIPADRSEAVLDLAALKTPPGDYLIAFYGSAVAKYRPGPESATNTSPPQDTVDIIVSEPISIRVKPAEAK